MTNIYPIIVPAQYFELPEEVRKVANPSPEAFGIVRPLGHDLFSLLVEVKCDIIKNVHNDDLARLGLDRVGAERAATDNLSELVKSGTIQIQLNKTSSGMHFAVWLGERLTSSCMLWPGLYEWARKTLETDQLVVMVPQVQLLCVAARGNPEFRSAIKSYMEQVVSGMAKQISTEWFELQPHGIAALDR